MIEPFPLALLLSVLVFVGFRFIIRLKSSTLISATLSILAFSFLLPDIAGSDNIYYWGLIPNENFNQLDALRLHIFFSSLAILVLIMSFLEIILLTRKIRLTKSLNTIRNDQIPIETRYKTVFWLIGLSLVLLSIGLVSGFLLDLNNVDYLVIKIIFTILQSSKFHSHINLYSHIRMVHREKPRNTRRIQGIRKLNPISCMFIN